MHCALKRIYILKSYKYAHTANLTILKIRQKKLELRLFYLVSILRKNA